MDKHNDIKPKRLNIKAVKSEKGCMGCIGNMSDAACLEVSAYVSERPIESCAKGFIYVEDKK